MSDKKIKVLIVDDSAVVRQVIQKILAEDKEFDIIGAVADPIFALKRMESQWPDVIVLDIEMPRMDGITFLAKIMAERPTPVVICSTLTEKGADVTLQAMAAGAVDIITKPKIGLKSYFQEEQAMFIQAIKSAARADPKKIRTRPAPTVRKKDTGTRNNADVILSAGQSPITTTTEHIVAIGTSTGGTQALELLLTSLPRVSPAIAIVQHMPEKFTQAFANRLNSLCEIEVMEAKDGDRLVGGRALIAPGGRHMMVKRSGAQYFVEVVDGPLVNRHRPSVDVLFRSAAKCAGKNALGVIMTGMGDDGAQGLLEMRKAGAQTIAQDEQTCVVFGMPKEAIKLGAAMQITPLDNIAAEILRFSKNTFGNVA